MSQRASKKFKDSLNSANSFQNCFNSNSPNLENVILTELHSMRNDLKKEIRVMGIKLAHSMGVNLIETDWFEDTDVSLKISKNINKPDHFDHYSENILRSFDFDKRMEGQSSSFSADFKSNQEQTENFIEKNLETTCKDRIIENEQPNSINNYKNSNYFAKKKIKTNSTDLLAKESETNNFEKDTHCKIKTLSPNFSEAASPLISAPIALETHSKQQTEKCHKSFVAVIKCEDLDELPFGSDWTFDDQTSDLDCTSNSLLQSSSLKLEERKKKTKKSISPGDKLKAFKTGRFGENAKLKDCSVVLSKQNFFPCKKRVEFKKHSSKPSYEKRNFVKAEAFVCDLCGKTFSQSNYLSLHKLSHTSKIKKCCICKKDFSSNLGLRNHMKKHGFSDSEDEDSSDGSEMECSICNKVMFSNCSFNSHMQSHFKQKTFNCKFCSKMFFSLKNLHLHMTQHEKSMFLCKNCNKSFINEKSYKLHLKQHIQTSFKCHFCSQKFEHLKTLLLHQNSCHNYGSYQPSALKQTFGKKNCLKNHKKRVINTRSKSLLH